LIDPTSTRLSLGSKKHKHITNNNASASQETIDPVLFYFHGITKQFGESYATQFVRMLIKFKPRDEDKGIIDLPSSIMKHSFFEKWCFSLGWKTTTDNTGCYKFEDRNTEETFWDTHLRSAPGGSFWNFGKCICRMCVFVLPVMTRVESVRFSRMPSDTGRKRIKSAMAPMKRKTAATMMIPKMKKTPRMTIAKNLSRATG
jgi:hypothetical protein